MSQKTSGKRGNMKLIFNDATEITVQQVKTYGDYIQVLTVGNTPEQLKVLFMDPTRTASMIVEERGRRGEPLVEYTSFYRTEEYTGKIYGVVMYRPDKLPEVQAEVQAAAVLVAQIQAQILPDEQAVTVKAIYPAWSPDSVQYAVDYKVQHEDILYKCISAHTSQESWAPGIAPSIWVAVETGEHAGTLEDPIPVPETVTTAGMEYEYGKYYQEDDTVYLCRRSGVENPEESYGQKITLYFPPSVLIGQYFVLAE